MAQWTTTAEITWLQTAHSFTCCVTDACRALKFVVRGSKGVALRLAVHLAEPSHLLVTHTAATTRPVVQAPTPARSSGELTPHRKVGQQHQATPGTCAGPQQKCRLAMGMYCLPCPSRVYCLCCRASLQTAKGMVKHMHVPCPSHVYCLCWRHAGFCIV
jgi:hypothetical protein